MKRMLVVLLLLVVPFAGLAQTPPPAEESTMVKIRKLDLYNQILPVLLTKEQLEKLLPAIERARSKAKEVERKEATELAALNKELDEAIAKARDQGQVPKLDMVQKVEQLLWSFTIRRNATVNENTNAVVAVLEAELNEGQKRAAANSLRPKAFDPNVREEELTTSDKLRLFTRVILLDSMAYDILVGLSRKR